MDHVRWTTRPQLNKPVLIAAFEGWNDAGDAASNAVRWLNERWHARTFASIDPEEFFDFSNIRPRVALDDDGRREISWPGFEFSAARIPGTDTDAVLLLGTEPQLRWRTFCEAVTAVAAACDVSLSLSLGALLADVPHTQPVPVIGTSEHPDVMERFGLLSSSYEGPTGIVGVLQQALADEAVPSASLWATVPSYVPAAPSPKAQLALLERIGQLLQIPMVTTDLQIAAAAYERQISELVDADDDTSAYVRGLEQRGTADELSSTDDFVAEVERFLRDQRDS